MSYCSKYSTIIHDWFVCFLCGFFTFRGSEVVQLGATQWGDHCSELHPWGRPGHFLQDVDQSRNWDGSIHWPSPLSPARGPAQEQQPHVGGEMLPSALNSFINTYQWCTVKYQLSTESQFWICKAHQFVQLFRNWSFAVYSFSKNIHPPACCSS